MQLPVGMCSGHIRAAIQPLNKMHALRTTVLLLSLYLLGIGSGSVFRWVHERLQSQKEYSRIQVNAYSDVFMPLAHVYDAYALRNDGQIPGPMTIESLARDFGLNASVLRQLHAINFSRLPPESDQVIAWLRPTDAQRYACVMKRHGGDRVEVSIIGLDDLCGELSKVLRWRGENNVVSEAVSSAPKPGDKRRTGE
jgi:hypothetical protein